MIELAALTVGIAVAVFTVTLAMLVLLVRILRGLDRDTRPDDDAGSDEDGGGGGSDRRQPRRPAPRGGGPAWWPEFERQLAEYQMQRDRERKRCDVPVA